MRGKTFLSAACRLSLLPSLSVLHSLPSQINCNKFTPVLRGLFKCIVGKICGKTAAEVDKVTGSESGDAPTCCAQNKPLEKKKQTSEILRLSKETCFPRAQSVEFFTFAYLRLFEVVLQLKRIQKQGHIKYTTGRRSHGVFKALRCLPSSSITSPHLPNPICCINISQTSFTYNDAPTIAIDSTFSPLTPQLQVTQS